MDRQRALEAVYEGIDSINALRSRDDAIARTPDVILVGECGRLDSLALVTLLLAVERCLLERTGHEVMLLDDSDIEFDVTTVRTPSALAELIVRKAGL